MNMNNQSENGNANGAIVESELAALKRVSDEIERKNNFPDQNQISASVDQLLGNDNGESESNPLLG